MFSMLFTLREEEEEGETRHGIYNVIIHNSTIAYEIPSFFSK